MASASSSSSPSTAAADTAAAAAANDLDDDGDHEHEHDGDDTATRTNGDNKKNKKQFDFGDILSNMNRILKPTGAEVLMKRKNERTGEVEECDQGEAVKITNYRIQSAATQHYMQGMTYDERKEWLVEKKDEGNALFQHGKFAEATECYMQAISGLTQGTTAAEKADATRTIHVPLVNNLAACFVELGEWGRAAALSDEVLKLDPDNLKALLRKGRALLCLREHDAAGEVLRRAKHRAAVELSKVDGEGAGDVTAAAAAALRKANRLLAKLRETERRHKQAARSMMQGGLGAMYDDKETAQAAATKAAPTTPSSSSSSSKEADTVGKAATAAQTVGGAADQPADEFDSESSIESDDELGQGTLVGQLGRRTGPASSCGACVKTLCEQLKAAVARCLCRCGAGKKDKLAELERRGLLGQKKKDE